MAGKFAEWADEVNIYIIYSIYEENKLPDFMAPQYWRISVIHFALCRLQVWMIKTSAAIWPI